MTSRHRHLSQSQGFKDFPVSQPTPVFTRSFTFQHASSSPTLSSSSTRLLAASVSTTTLRDVEHFTATDVRQKNFLSLLEMSVGHVNPYSFEGGHTTTKITVKQMFDKFFSYFATTVVVVLLLLCLILLLPLLLFLLWYKKHIWCQNKLWQAKFE